MMRIVMAFLITVISFSVFANYNPMDMEKLSPSNPSDVRVKFTPLDSPKTVAELGTFVIINTTRSDKCPAGGFYLINRQRATYQFIDAGTCEADVVASLSNAPAGKFSLVTQVLTFSRGAVITARYPLYGY